MTNSCHFSVVAAFFKGVLVRIGVPRVVRGESGTCFTSCEMQQFALGFTQAFSSPRYPPAV